MSNQPHYMSGCECKPDRAQPVSNEVLSILIDLHEDYLELAQKIATIERFVMRDVLEEVRYERCEKSLKRLRELLAVTVPPEVREKQTVGRQYDPDAHLGRCGVE